MEIILHTLKAGLNDWGALHPLIVHFPIVLLTIAPLFIVLGLIFSKNSGHFFLTAAILLVLGTTSLFLSIETGDMAAERISDAGQAVFSTLAKHHNAAEQTLKLYIPLTLVFIVLVFFNKRLQTMKLQLPLMILVLITSAFGILKVTETSSYGGMLVHKHGVHTDIFNQ